MSKKAIKKVLQGYRREGKRFVPPMKQIPNLKELSYLDDLLPELIWLGLIHDHMGYHFGARMLEAIVTAIEHTPPPLVENLALQSTYLKLTDEQKERIVEILRAKGMLPHIQQALAPLSLLYDGFAMLFLGPPPDRWTKESLIQRISECVGSHSDRYKTPAVMLYGCMLLTRLAAHKMFFPKEMDIPDFNAVIESPESDEARRAASFMRASAMAEGAIGRETGDWPRKFWNSGAKLSPCEPLGSAAEDE